MRLAALFGTPAPARQDQRPRDNELDLFGLTHPGRVRTENQDHFLLCTVHPQVVVHATSLPDPDGLPLRGQRLATVMLVADGVGGGVGGREASRLAAEAVTRYVAFTLRCYHSAGASADEEFHTALRTAAVEAHTAVSREALRRGLERQMATTLSLAIVVWPWLYVLQVGDSRCYVLEQGILRQVTRDQTVAEALVDEGVLTKDQVGHSPLSNVLASAIGGAEALPVVSRADVTRRGTVIMLCTDGLTKHVGDAEIAEILRGMVSAEDACRRLCERALERGGTDNITIVIGRAREA